MSRDDRLRRLLYGIQRQFRDSPARSARAKEIVQHVKPWTLGRIGKIEKHVSRKMIMGHRDFTTGELARAWASLRCGSAWLEGRAEGSGAASRRLRALM